MFWDSTAKLAEIYSFKNNELKADGDLELPKIFKLFVGPPFYTKHFVRTMTQLFVYFSSLIKGSFCLGIKNPPHWTCECLTDRRRLR